MLKKNYIMIAIIALLLSLLYFKESPMIKDSNDIISVKLSEIENKIEEIKVSISKIESYQYQSSTNNYIENFKKDNVAKPKLNDRVPHNFQASLSLGKNPQFSFPNQKEGPGALPPPLAWINDLAPEKRHAVIEIFKDSSNDLRMKIAEMNPGDRGDIARMSFLVEDANEGIKRKMNSLLTDHEYEQFLNSLPESFMNKVK
jgi:PIN domain nuclease of toxin-antitoxin system